MTHAIDTVLRPFVKWYFQSWFWKYLPRKEKILWFFSKPYFVVGKDELCRKLIDFISHHYNILLNFCGDDATNDGEIIKTQNIYLDFIALTKELGLTKQVILSLKNSRFGCFNKILKWHGKDAITVVARTAADAGMRIVFDGERLTYCHWVLVFADILNRKYHNVGVRLQAYNKKFIYYVKKFAGRIALSVCKGAYKEPKSKTITKSKTVAHNMVEAAKYVAEVLHQHIEVDTHDGWIITECQDLCNYDRISYGLLLNVKAWRARELMHDRERVLIYLVYIENKEDLAWIGYSIRRLIEKPTYCFLPLKMWLAKLFGKNDYWG